MSRGYKIGNKIRIIKATKARNYYGQSSGPIIDKGSKGIVVGYNDKYTDKMEDDLAKVKITEGDKELTGKEVWVKADDFSNIVKKY